MSRFLFSTVMIVLVSQVFGRTLLDASIEKRSIGYCGTCWLGCPTGQHIRACTEDDFKHNRVICKCVPISESKRDILMNEE